MIASQLMVYMLFTTVQAQIAVSLEKRLIGQGRNYFLLAIDAAMAGYNAMHSNTRPTAIKS
jgi:hypothetical protein